MIEEHVRWTKKDIELLKELAKAIEEWKKNEPRKSNIAY